MEYDDEGWIYQQAALWILGTLPIRVARLYSGRRENASEGVPQAMMK